MYAHYIVKYRVENYSMCFRHFRQSGGASMGKIGWQARGGLHRNVDVLMELQLNKVHHIITHIYIYKLF